MSDKDRLEMATTPQQEEHLMRELIKDNPSWSPEQVVDMVSYIKDVRTRKSPVCHK